MQLPITIPRATAFAVLSGGGEKDLGFLLRGWDLASPAAPNEIAPQFLPGQLHSPLTSRLGLGALALDSVQHPVAFQRYQRRKAIKDCALSAASHSSDIFGFATAPQFLRVAVDGRGWSWYNGLVQRCTKPDRGIS